MMKSFLICLILPFIYLSSFAQDIVLDKNVEEQYEEKHGQNMRHYGHFYEGIGTFIPYNNISGAKAELGRSMEFTFGYRYKLKLLSFYAIGFDLSNRWQKYGIASEDGVAVDIASNPFSQASQVKKLSLNVSALAAEAYNRINIGKRGNILGNYVDVGIKGEWNYGRKMFLKTEAPNDDYFEKSKTVQKNLQFIEKFSTIITARIGINKVCIYGNYRFSDVIVDGYTSPELPPLTAGVQVAF